jgi:Right handed beta helix region
MVRQLRLWVVLSVITLAFIAGSSPAAAAVRTRWVDDDGHAGPTGCGGHSAASKRVQKAVDASGPGDTIKICPGRYTGGVIIPHGKAGLHVHGVRPWKARLYEPSSLEGAVLEVDSNRVVVDGLAFVSPTVGPCSETLAGIGVIGARNVTISNVHVTASTAGDTLGVCGLKVGILLNGGGSATIQDSLIRDFKVDGVYIDENSTATVRHNSIEWVHADAPVVATQLGGQAGTHVVPAGEPPIVGVIVDNGSDATIRGNTIFSDPRWTASGQLGSAVFVTTNGSARVRHNVIRRVDNGLFLMGDPVTAKGNDIRRGAGIGILLLGPGHLTAADNRVTRQAAVGLQAFDDTSGASITDNDFRGNAGIDCIDLSSDGGTAGTANSWTGNRGDESAPTGLCSP